MPGGGRQFPTGRYKKASLRRNPPKDWRESVTLWGKSILGRGNSLGKTSEAEV